MSQSSPNHHRPRQSLRLRIHPLQSQSYRHLEGGSSAATTPSPISARLSRKGTWSYESPSGEAYERICTVIALYDFNSSDPDHLSFHQSDILEIVRQEDSGWWAAVRDNGQEVGWIPASYVRVLSNDEAEKLYTLQTQTSIPQYDRDNGSRSAPPSLKRLLDSNAYTGEDNPNGAGIDQSVFKLDFLPGQMTDSPNKGKATEQAPTDTRQDSPPAYTSPKPLPYPLPPPTPSSSKGNNLILEKSLPVSPRHGPAPNPSEWEARYVSHSRSNSGSGDSSADRNRRRQHVDDHSSLQRLSSLIQTHNLDSSAQFADTVVDTADDPVEDEDGNLDSPTSPISPISPIGPVRTQSRVGKIKRLTGDDDAQAFHNAKQAQANLPWYLRPQYGIDEIKLEYDGSVKAGTLPALVERLVIDPLRMSQQENFRRVFLMTFRTFASATEVFDLLISHYEMDVPPNLTTVEFDQWKREKLRPTQKRVLTVLTLWLEEYDMLNQAPEIAPRLQEFLSLIVTPASLSLTAKHMLASLERLTFAEPHDVEVNPVTQPKRWKKKWKGEHELARMDPLEMAQHLALYEHGLYKQIQGQECFNWTKTRTGPTVKNMLAFIATYDKLADWVKMSVLEVDGLGKRANAVDFWIRVAEKCRSLHNYSSLSAIIAALSSTVLSRLHFTWLNASRESYLASLLKFNAPGGNYSYYRNVLESVDGPCVPYAGPFLKMMVYAQDQHEDNVIVQSGENQPKYTLIHFVKRKKWFEASSAFLRFQQKQYSFPENPAVSNFVVAQMSKAAAMGERWFWARSDEVQKAELVHADIKKGLQAAGF